ncbi:hypothetical protein B0H19DRAFT_1067862 [Mycena capillaripes]|nr:hypothetical protein B0H19DRAFT_1067862 [Mycena capillaripes]
MAFLNQDSLVKDKCGSASRYAGANYSHLVAKHLIVNVLEVLGNNRKGQTPFIKVFALYCPPALTLDSVDELTCTPRSSRRCSLSDGPTREELGRPIAGREDNNKDKPADLLILRLKPPTRNRSLTATVLSAPETSILVRKVGNTYSSDMLPDHRGSFAHDEAKLVQHAYKDEDGNLIGPHEFYSKITEGALFLAQISLSTYIIKDNNPKFMDSKVYHINIDKLTILDPGYGVAWAPAIPNLPGKAGPSTPHAKRS